MIQIDLFTFIIRTNRTSKDSTLFENTLFGLLDMNFCI